MISVISGTCSGRLLSHLRPQILKLAEKTCAQPTSTGPNISNPLEAYEVEFSTASLSVKIREWTSTLGHRRLIIPSETTVFLRVLESVVDMSFGEIAFISFFDVNFSLFSYRNSFECIPYVFPQKGSRDVNAAGIFKVFPQFFKSLALDIALHTPSTKTSDKCLYSFQI
ncbi:MAG: hypothetical protein ACREOZ_01080 [Gloeomargaritales cyanobacterium]